MKFEIETARHQHRVKNEPALRAAHADFIKGLTNVGASARVHQSPVPVEAFISHGRWVGLCECGAGVATDPAFSAAYCFGCGAIHDAVIFPEDREDIEHLLLARPRSENRNWAVGEKLRELLADNGEHKVKL